MKTLLARQREFMKACGQNVEDTPTFNTEDIALWSVLIEEEVNELGEALIYADADQDIRHYPANMANICAEAVDVVYVVMGLMNAMGLPFNEMFDAVHEANMQKVVDGKVKRRHSDGKILKPEGWMPADKLAVINEAWA